MGITHDNLWGREKSIGKIGNNNAAKMPNQVGHDVLGWHDENDY